MNSHKYALTRYLFPTGQVRVSLLMSLLERKTNEALFWAYELYYSGFKENVFKYLERIFYDMYKTANPSLEKFITQTIDEWKLDSKKDYLLGSIVSTLASRDYCVAEFISNFLNIKCKAIKKPVEKKRKLIIKLNPSDIDIYHTFITLPTENWKVLEYVCVFPIRKNYNQIFRIHTPSNTEEIYNTDKWLYFASLCPVWKNRFLTFGGTIDHQKQEVLFPTDDAADAFHETWGYEPDEQPKSVRSNIGLIYPDENIQQVSLDEFCKIYNITVVESSPSTLSNTLLPCL
jgi:hypothetical protein